MLAIAIHDLGRAPSLEELPEPVPERGEVRVRVQCSSVNAIDLRTVSGALRGTIEHRFPLVPGTDFAGVVDAVGPDSHGYAVGDEVFGVVQKPFVGGGSFADALTVSVDRGIARRPDALPRCMAGALGWAGAAAIVLVDALGVAPGRTVLVAGAPGGVGSIALQLARAGGARVIATARTGTERDHVEALGAAAVVDAGAISSGVRKVAPKGVDAIAHIAGDSSELVRLLVPGGSFASAADIAPTASLGDLLRRLSEHVVEHRIWVPIFRTYRLAEVPRALADFEHEAKLGKLAVDVAG